jgi:hypothetical protein
MRTGVVSTAVVAACFCVQSDVQAAPITFEVSALVSFLEGSAALANVFPSVAFGQSITGRYTFEPLAADAISADATEGLYPVSGSPYGMTFGVGGVTFASNAVSMVIRNNAVGGIYDEYIAFFSTATPFSPANASPPSTASTNFSIQLALASTNTSLYSTDALPAGVPDLSQFDFTRSFSLSFFDLAGNFGFLDSTVTSIREVPEPGTMTLLGLAIPAIVVRRRKRRQRQ